MRALCVISAGFAETGAEGAERQDRLLTLVRSHGGRLIGPNCLGIAASGRAAERHLRAVLHPGRQHRLLVAERRARPRLPQEATARGLGLSAFVSIGNKADVSSNDLLEYFEDDPATELVLLYLESFGNPRRFGRFARRVARSKPILAMKSGRSRAGIRAAGSHTAALAGSGEAVDALFHQAGVIRADTLGQLLDVASLLATQPLPGGRSVGGRDQRRRPRHPLRRRLRGGGPRAARPGPTTRARPWRVAAGGGRPRQPVDLLGSATAATYEAALPPVLSDPSVDAVIVLFVPPVVAGAARWRPRSAAPSTRSTTSASRCSRS